MADGDWPSGGLISIHALRKESDPHGSRSSAPASTFQSTLSVRRATRSSAAGVAHVHISIHALRKESDLATPGHHTPLTLFQSTLSVRRATRCYSSLRSLQTTFQSTLSVRRATRPFDWWNSTLIFQSTLSVRRATHYRVAIVGQKVISIHALRKESDVEVDDPVVDWFGISIHALRKESDGTVQRGRPRRVISIHALRKESDLDPSVDLRQVKISIHALRKESDSDTLAERTKNEYFNPRSP